MSLLPSYRLVAIGTSLLSGWRDCRAAYGRRIRTAVDRLVSQVDQEVRRAVVVAVREFASLSREVKIAFGIMPWMPLVPSTTWVT
jgi:hypothetical protein